MQKIDESFYVNVNCDLEIEELREKRFPNKLENDLYDKFPSNIFRLPSGNVLECTKQKVKEGKLNEMFASERLFCFIDTSSAQLEEGRRNYFNLYKKMIENLFECMEKLF
ncbi:CLUMA_CG020775, isoform A [Clunio marinus]|uniref:CLUMA_CG020775, isoform A n=1 Tax=Clunio marinus TaxID=568069 RepID=A0A1J1J601_9DIPT|nr:CLUMA_CG020775, isoform A [Clunio marinus]